MLNVPPRPFTTDGCSGGMSCLWRLVKGENPPWQMACQFHDRSYWQGGTRADRSAADALFLRAVALHSAPWAVASWLAVRLFGHPLLPLPWRWGYGWPWPRGYERSHSTRDHLFNPPPEVAVPQPHERVPFDFAEEGWTRLPDRDWAAIGNRAKALAWLTPRGVVVWLGEGAQSWKLGERDATTNVIGRMGGRQHAQTTATASAGTKPAGQVEAAGDK